MNSHQKTISAMQMNFKNLDNKATARRNVLTYGNSCIFQTQHTGSSMSTDKAADITQQCQLKAQTEQ